MGIIKSCFDATYSELQPPFKVDKALLQRVHEYGMAFLNKNEDHIRFFGGNLLGVHPIRFTTSDKNIWLDEVVRIDEYELRDLIMRSPGNILREDWIRATDVMNLSCLYLCHRIMNSTLSESDKQQGLQDVLLVLHYKYLSSLMAHYFNKAPANEDTALAVYAALSKKYAIKQEGSWYAMLVARCKDIVDTRSIHYQTLAKFDDDAAIVYAITDTQGRIRSVVKKQYKVFVEVRAQNAKISGVGGHVELESGLTVKDITRVFPPFRRYIDQCLLSKKEFIKPELIDVIVEAIYTMPPQLFVDALNYIQEHAKDADVSELVNEILLHAFEYLGSSAQARNGLKDIGTLVSKLRNIYMASRSTDPSLMKMRELGEKVVSRAISSKSAATIAAVRTGVFLYIVTRTFSKRYYGG